jgi:hypothetical protein
VPMSYFAYSCVTYVCGLKRGGSVTARRGAGLPSWGSLDTACDGVDSV